MNILIVDDSRFLRIANERALAKAGHRVLSAGDGEEGLRLACEHRPHLVILDIMLPKLSGVDLLRALRQDPATSRTPIMILTRPSAAERGETGERRGHRVFRKVDAADRQGNGTVLGSRDRATGA